MSVCLSVMRLLPILPWKLLHTVHSPFLQVALSMTSISDPASSGSSLGSSVNIQPWEITCRDSQETYIGFKRHFRVVFPNVKFNHKNCLGHPVIRWNRCFGLKKHSKRKSSQFQCIFWAAPGFNTTSMIHVVITECEHVICQGFQCANCDAYLSFAKVVVLECSDKTYKDPPGYKK